MKFEVSNFDWVDDVAHLDLTYVDTKPERPKTPLLTYMGKWKSHVAEWFTEFAFPYETVFIFVKEGNHTDAVFVHFIVSPHAAVAYRLYHD